MIVTRTFKFYAAHRNEYLSDKCSNLHGHRYGVEVELRPVCMSDAGVSILFGEIEALLAPTFERFDHALLIHRDDPARQALLDTQACGKVVLMDKPTSAENLCLELLARCIAACPHVNAVTLRETDSCTVRMDRDDLEVLA